MPAIVLCFWQFVKSATTGSLPAKADLHNLIRADYFIRKVYETDPLICPKCQGEMRIISFIDQPDVIKKILDHLGRWEDAHARRIRRLQNQKRSLLTPPTASAEG